MENKFDIKCIGYKPTFLGGKIYYYKLVLDGSEYLIIDCAMGTGYMEEMIWTKKNEFDSADFADELSDEIKKQIRKTKKENNELTIENTIMNVKGGELAFFTQHKIDPSIPEEKFARKGNIYTADEINDILSALEEVEFMDYHRFKTIKKEDFEETEELQDLFKDLIGYKFKHTIDGEHKNDGQMVEYTFTFVSPKNEETVFSTEMCLMCGWNYHKEQMIK